MEDRLDDLREDDNLADTRFRKKLMRNLIWALETLDVIAYRTKIQIHADTIPRGKITCGTVNQAPIKKNHRTRSSLRTDDSALFSPALLTSWRINW